MVGVVRIGSSITISETFTCDSMSVCFLFNRANFASGFLDLDRRNGWGQINFLPSIRDTPFVYVLSSKEVPFQLHELSIELLEDVLPRFRVSEFFCVYALE